MNKSIDIEPSKQRKNMNRRDFLRNSAMAAAGAAVLPNLVNGAEAWDVKATETTHAPIRMGVIGIGIQCIGHIRHLMHRSDARIMALCDVESIRLNRAKGIVDEAYEKRFGKEARPVDTYEDFREMLKHTDIDAVLIATPTHWHACMSIMAARTGKDVYCEQPMTLSIREGRVNKKLGLEIINKITHQEDSINVLFDGALLYSEEVPVRGGRFETEFVTPRKINFGDTAAEFIAWGYSANERSISRLFKTGIQISGMSSYADSIHDDVPPAISIQSCYSGGKATTFANSQRVKLQSPACLQVVIEDSTALDFREQADEGISFEVVGKETPYHPYPYLEQTSKRAVIRKTFPAQNYPEGKYEFHVYASDVLGNSSDQELFIEITGELEEGLVDVFNAPNPMGKKGTTFYFKNLAVDRPSTVNIFIYNQNGRLVKVIKNAVSGVTHWDGRDNHGRKLANGLYHYVVRSEVPATADFKKSTWTKKQKLVISR